MIKQRLNQKMFLCKLNGYILKKQKNSCMVNCFYALI